MEQETSFSISIDGHWIGKWADYQGTRFYAVKAYKRYTNALKAVERIGKGVIKIYECWGSFPSQRRVIWSNESE